MTAFLIRDAVPGDMGALRDVFRRSSLSNPFYERAGFVAGQEVETRFGPAPRMHLEVRP